MTYGAVPQMHRTKRQLPRWPMVMIRHPLPCCDESRPVPCPWRAGALVCSLTVGVSTERKSDKLKRLSMCGERQQIIGDADRKRFSVRIEQKSKKSRLGKKINSQKKSRFAMSGCTFFAG